MTGPRGCLVVVVPGFRLGTYSLGGLGTVDAVGFVLLFFFSPLRLGLHILSQVPAEFCGRLHSTSLGIS